MSISADYGFVPFTAALDHWYIHHTLSFAPFIPTLLFRQCTLQLHSYDMIMLNTSHLSRYHPTATAFDYSYYPYIFFLDSLKDKALDLSKRCRQKKYICTTPLPTFFTLSSDKIGILSVDYYYLI